VFLQIDHLYLIDKPSLRAVFNRDVVIMVDEIFESGLFTLPILAQHRAQLIHLFFRPFLYSFCLAFLAFSLFAAAVACRTHLLRLGL
jgi:hypothetical protein